MEEIRSDAAELGGELLDKCLKHPSKDVVTLACAIRVCEQALWEAASQNERINLAHARRSVELVMGTLRGVIVEAADVPGVEVHTVSTKEVGQA